MNRLRLWWNIKKLYKHDPTSDEKFAVRRKNDFTAPLNPHETARVDLFTSDYLLSKAGISEPNSLNGKYPSMAVMLRTRGNIDQVIVTESTYKHIDKDTLAPLYGYLKWKLKLASDENCQINMVTFPAPYKIVKMHGNICMDISALSTYILVPYLSRAVLDVRRTEFLCGWEKILDNNLIGQRFKKHYMAVLETGMSYSRMI